MRHNKEGVGFAFILFMIAVAITLAVAIFEFSGLADALTTNGI